MRKCQWEEKEIILQTDSDRHEVVLCAAQRHHKTTYKLNSKKAKTQINCAHLCTSCF